MAAVRSICRCGLHAQGIIKQIVAKPIVLNNGIASSSFQCFQVRLFSTKEKVAEKTVTTDTEKVAGKTVTTDTEKVAGKKITTDAKKEDENTRKIDALPDLKNLPHFKKEIDAATSKTPEGSDVPIIGATSMPHPIWSEEQLENVQITHRPAEGIVDKMALYSVKLMRKSFDLLSGFNRGERNEHKWILRICFLETVAGVPGMVAAMTRHLHSLRRLKRDFGWIHTLLEEAENERMHLLTALQLRKPSRVFRFSVIAAQGTFVTMFSVAYMLSPRFCHRFVGYLEEEAVVTYTKCVEDIRHGPMSHWQTTPAPESAIEYWKLPEDAKMLDVILAIRADEAHHRVVNHTLASLKDDEYNPYKPGH